MNQTDFLFLLVSTKALHAYSTDTSGVGSKTADEEQVAYWGNKVWGGP